jgi:hypothetical protein
VKTLEKAQGRLSVGIQFSFERASQGYLQQKYETALFDYVLAPEGLKMRVTTQSTSHFGDKDMTVGGDPNSAVVEGVLQKVHWLRFLDGFTISKNGQGGAVKQGYRLMLVDKDGVLVSEFQLTEKDLGDPEAFVAALKQSIENIEDEEP